MTNPCANRDCEHRVSLEADYCSDCGDRLALAGAGRTGRATLSALDCVLGSLATRASIEFKADADDGPGYYATVLDGQQARGGVYLRSDRCSSLEAAEVALRGLLPPQSDIRMRRAFPKSGRWEFSVALPREVRA